MTQTQTQTQHTPGPWKAQRDIRHATNNGCLTDDSPKAWAVYGKGYRVACISENIAIPFDQDREAEANAALMAAAPELLAALRDVLELHIAHHNNPAHAAARAVIRKAVQS